MTDLSYDRGLLRVYQATSDGSHPRAIVGAAFLVSEDRALTCAHVVLAALEKHEDYNYRPGERDTVYVDFVHLPGNPILKATVEGWYAFQDNPVFSEAEDIAVLRLIEPLPAGAEAFRLTVSTDSNIPVTVQGFPEESDGGDVVEGKLLGSTAEGWMQLDTTLVQKAIIPGFSGAPVWNAQRDVIGMVTRSASRKRTKNGSPSAFMIPTAILQKALPLLANPYKGLSAFREEDANRFFGREQEVEYLLDHLNQEPHVAIITGESGSGKSSLMFAGLLPKLPNTWLPISFRPQGRPFEELYNALFEDDTLNALTETVPTLRDKPITLASLRKDMTILHELARALKKRKKKKLLLTIDQFEEIHTLNSNQRNNREEASTGKAFVEQLAKTVLEQPRNEGPIIGLVLTLRESFISIVLPETLLNKEYRCPLETISRENLLEAIEEPAKKQNATLEDDLVKAILDDVKTKIPTTSQTDSTKQASAQPLKDSLDSTDLPLVQFALTELWKQQKYREGRYTLTAEDYRAIDGVRGALNRYVENFYKHLSNDNQQRAQAIFLSLVYLGERTKPAREVVEYNTFTDDQQNLINRVNNEVTLLVLNHNSRNNQPTVEVIHEALIDGWDTLQTWVSSESDFLLWRTRLRKAIKDWQKLDQNRNELLTGRLLDEAETKLEHYHEWLSQSEKDYIQVSTQYHKRKRRNNKIFRSLAILFLISFVVGILYFWQEARLANEQLTITNTNLEDTNRQLENANSELAANQLELEQERDNAQQQANIALSRQLMSQARLAASAPSNLNGFDQTASLLAAHALNINFDNDITKQMVDILKFIYPFEEILYRDYSNITLSIVSSDGSLLASGGRDGTLTFQNLNNGQLIIPPEQAHQGLVSQVEFSPNGSLFVSGDTDGKVAFWNPNNGQLIAPPEQAHQGWVRRLVFSSDGNQFVSGGEDGTLAFWNPENGQLIAPPEQTHQVWRLPLIFSPNGDQLVSGSEDGKVAFWNPNNGQLIAPPEQAHENQVKHLVFSSGGDQLISGGWDGKVAFWNPNNGQLIAPPEQAHEGIVSELIFSPDTNQFISGGQDGRVIFWSLNNGQLIVKPEQSYQGLISRIVFNHDRTQLVSGGQRGTLAFWNPESGQLIAQTEQAHQGLISQIVFSPNGDQLVSGSEDGTVAFWNPESGQLIAQTEQAHQDWVSQLVFNSDRDQLIGVSEDDVVTFWNLRNGHPIAQPEQTNAGAVSQLVFSPNGNQLISGSEDGTLAFWNPENGQLIAQPEKAHQDWVSQLVFSPDGNQLASGGLDGRVLFWNPENGQLIAQPEQAPKSAVSQLVFSPNGNQLVSVGEDGTLAFWNPKNGQLIAQPEQAFKSVSSVLIFSRSDETQITSGGQDGRVLFWNPKNGQLIAPPEQANNGLVFQLVFSPDGTQLVSGGQDGTVAFWNPENGQLIAQPEQAHDGLVSRLAFSPDGTRLVSGGQDGTVAFWNPENGQLIAQPEQANNGLVFQLVFSPDGTQLVSGGQDGTVAFWNPEDGQLIAQPEQANNGLVSQLVFSPDGTQLVSGGQDGTVAFWNPENGQLIAQPEQAHSGPVFHLVFSPNGNRLVSRGQEDGTVAFWNPENGQLIAQPERAHDDLAFQLVFNPNGTQFVSSGLNGTVAFWNPENGQLIAQPEQAHDGAVSKLVFSPNGTQFVSGGEDGKVVFWNPEDGQLIAQPEQAHEGWVSQLVFSPSGNQLVSSGEDGKVVFWDANPLSWQEKACRIAGRNFTQEEWQRYLGDRAYEQTCFDDDGNLLPFTTVD